MTDPSRLPPREPDDAIDAALREAWRAQSSESPPPELDAAILAAAHRAVQSVPEQASAGARTPQRWWWPLAAAATIGAIALGLLQLAPPEETPQQSTASDTPAPSAPPRVPPRAHEEPRSPSQPGKTDRVETPLQSAARDRRQAAGAEPPPSSENRAVDASTPASAKRAPPKASAKEQAEAQKEASSQAQTAPRAQARSDANRSTIPVTGESSAATGAAPPAPRAFPAEAPSENAAGSLSRGEDGSRAPPERRDRAALAQRSAEREAKPNDEDTAHKRAALADQMKPKREAASGGSAPSAAAAPGAPGPVATPAPMPAPAAPLPAMPAPQTPPSAMPAPATSSGPSAMPSAAAPRAPLGATTPRSKLEAEVPRTPQQWIEALRELRRDGRERDAQATLNEFRAAYPDADARLPSDLRDWAAGVPRTAR